MTDKLERPLYLNMQFGEALTRYIGTKPEEVQPPKGRRRKTARPKPGGGSVDPETPPPAPAGSSGDAKAGLAGPAARVRYDVLNTAEADSQIGNNVHNRLHPQLHVGGCKGAPEVRF